MWPRTLSGPCLIFRSRQTAREMIHWNFKGKRRRLVSMATPTIMLLPWLNLESLRTNRDHPITVRVTLSCRPKMSRASNFDVSPSTSGMEVGHGYWSPETEAFSSQFSHSLSLSPLCWSNSRWLWFAKEMLPRVLCLSLSPIFLLIKYLGLVIMICLSWSTTWQFKIP